MASRCPEHNRWTDADLYPAEARDGPKRGTTVKLLRQPGMEKWEEFTCLNSLREVEPTVKLIVDDGGLDDVSDQPIPEQAPQQEGAPA